MIHLRSLAAFLRDLTMRHAETVGRTQDWECLL